jgi:ParB family chromosome partitioning protein
MAGHKALGRGLEALFSSQSGTKPDVKAAVETFSTVTASATHDVRDVAVEKIKPNRHQPRTDFNQEALEELADSIRTHGIAQPLIVTETLPGGEFELVMGERRLRAAKMAGLAQVPCVVRKFSNRERFELAIVENIQREDLNGMEESLAIDGLMKEFNLTQEQVALALGKSRSAVANTLRFLRLHESVQSALRSAQISEGHAKILAGVPEHSEQLRLLEKIIDQKLTVRDLEGLIQNESVPTKGKKAAARREPSPEVKAYEEAFQRILGRRVELQTSGKKGWMKFAFYSPWDLDILCKRLGLMKDDGGFAE